MDPASETRVSQAVRSLSDGFTSFGLDLLSGPLPREGNVLFSPLGVAAALAALLPGARGETARELAEALRIVTTDDDPPVPMSEFLAALGPRILLDQVWDQETGAGTEVEREAFRLTLATALFVEEAYPLHTSYCDLVSASYGADFFSVLFADTEAAAGSINEWVDGKTDGRITNLVTSDDLDDARLVLANAVYFKAEWADQFAEHATQPRRFFLPPGSDAESVEVPMMHREGSYPYWRSEAGEVEAVRLPYEQGVSMLVILPEAGRFEAVGKALSAEVLTAIADVRRPSPLDLHMPRFEVRSESRLGEALRALGVRRAFDATTADFSGITPAREGLVLSEAIHQAWVRVDENGTEAAAATALTALAAGALEEAPAPIPFVVDRPFYFFIRDDATGAVLFMGGVTDPGA